MSAIRTAVIRTDDVDRVRAFLPSNYDVIGHADHQVTIQGIDNAGWTLDDYVLPRLASGCLFGSEILTGLEEAWDAETIANEAWSRPPADLSLHACEGGGDTCNICGEAL